MFNYCNKWKLQLYVKKTKIVVFSRGKIRKIPNVFFGPKLLDVVDNDTYLGVKFNFNGRFVNEKQLRYSNGCRAMVSFLRKARTLALPIYIHLQLFQTLVTPVVMHLKFCKYILFLSKCTYTNMVYGETGEIPLSSRVKCRIIKYWRKIITCQARKLSSYIYKFIYSLHSNNIYHSPWILFVKKILCDCGFSGVWQSQTIPTGIDLFNNNILQPLRDQFIQQ